MDRSSLSDRRSSISRKRMNSLLDGILKEINEIEALEKAGKIENSKAAMEELANKLEAKLEEMTRNNLDKDNTPVDRSFLPATGEVLAENDRVILKMISSEERDLYIDLSYECSITKSAFKDALYKADLWEDFMREKSATASIYDKKSGDFVGYCRIRDLGKNDWEISIEEKEAYRHKGIGYDAMGLFIAKLAELSIHRFFRARIDIDNTASQKLVKKLGGYPDGVSEFMLHGEDLKEFQRDNMDYIDDNIRIIADEFFMDPEDILGQVLEYRIDAETLLE